MPFRATLLAVVVALAVLPPAARAEDPTLLPTKSMTIKPFSAVDFLGRPPKGAPPFDMPDVPDDDPTIVGGSLRIENFPRVASDTIPLPAQLAPFGWRGLGRPAGTKGYRYTGRGTADDPCGYILLKPKRVRIICPGIRFYQGGITPPFDEAATLTLRIGSGKKYCATASVATAVENDLTAFVARNRPAGLACFGSPSGAFLADF